MSPTARLNTMSTNVGKWHCLPVKVTDNGIKLFLLYVYMHNTNNISLDPNNIMHHEIYLQVLVLCIA